MDAKKSLTFYEDVEEEDGEDERSEESAIESNRRSKVYKWSSSLLDFGFAFIGCDPFAIYGQDKVSEKAAPANTCNPPVTFGRPSSWRSRWAKISMFLGIYVAVKSVAAFVLRCVIVHLSTHSPDASKRFVGLLESLLLFIGDPFSPLSNLRLYVHLLGPMWCLASTSVLPYYLAHYRPLDCPFARFLLAPERELQRFDAAAEGFLNQMYVVAEEHRFALADSFWMAKICQLNQSSYLIHLRRVKMQLRQLKQLMRKLNVLRPKTLRPEWHRHTYESFFRIFLPSLAVNSLIALLLSSSYNLFAWQARCDELKLAQSTPARQTDSQMSCSLLEAFSPADLLLATEINLQMVLIAVNNYVFFVIMHFCQIRPQLHLTDSIDKQLQQVLNKLRSFNRANQGEMKVSERTARGQLDMSLTKALLSLRMFERESCGNVSFVGQIQTILNLFMLMITFITSAMINPSASWAKSLLSGQKLDFFSSGSSRNLVIANWIFGIIYTNAFLLHCASIPARANKLDRSVFSIMAELNRLQASPTSLRHPKDIERQQQLTRARRLFQTDPLVASWRRFVLSRINASDLPSVQVFNIRLTYEQVLKINFYIATIISSLTLRN